MVVRRTVTKLWVDGRLVELLEPAEYVQVGRSWELRTRIGDGPHNRRVKVSAVLADGSRVYGPTRVR